MERISLVIDADAIDVFRENHLLRLIFIQIKRQKLILRDLRIRSNLFRPFLHIALLRERRKCKHQNNQKPHYRPFLFRIKVKSLNLKALGLGILPPWLHSLYE